MNAPPLLPPRPHLHPALLIAAASVSAFALAGIGVLTGVIPSTFGTTPAVQTTEATPATAAGPAPLAAAPAATSAPAAPAPAARPAKPARAAAPRDSAPKTAAEGGVRAAAPVAVCRDCGRIESIREIAHDGDASGLGAVAGGVVGAVLGNQVGGGRGKSAATLLGGIGGAVAGHQIEKSQHKKYSYEIIVRFDDGTSQVLTQDAPPAWRQGDRVKMVNGTLNAN